MATVKVGGLVEHVIYGVGEVLELRGRFVRVKFDRRLPGIITNNSTDARKHNTLSVGVAGLL